MADVLEEVLEERRDHLKQALLDLEETDPIVFYRLIAMPRLRQLARTATEAAKTARTAAEAEEERMWMDALTDQAQKELDKFMNHDKSNVTTPAAVSS